MLYWLLPLGNHGLIGFFFSCSKEERRLDIDEKPLVVQLNWNKDDREGRFVLKNENDAAPPKVGPSGSQADARCAPEFLLSWLLPPLPFLPSLKASAEEPVAPCLVPCSPRGPAAAPSLSEQSSPCGFCSEGTSTLRTVHVWTCRCTLIRPVETCFPVDPSG